MQEKIQARDRDKIRQLVEEQFTADTSAIDLYITKNKIAAMKDKSGLRYVITQQGKGAKPTSSSIITVNYKGSLMVGGTVVDQSQSPVEYRLSGFIQGWQIGFQLLNKGTKATLYIPSSLAYGADGSPPVIPPNANLVFEVELVDFK